MNRISGAAVIGRLLVVGTFVLTLSIDSVDVLAQSAEQRTLTFPDDVVYGEVLTYDQPETMFGYPQLGKPISTQPATGMVRVPASGYTRLLLNANGSKDLSWLRDLPAESINGLSFDDCTLDANAFETIARFKNLRSLGLRPCAMAEGTDVSSVQIAAQLQNFTFRAASEDQIEAFARWAARCPNVAYLRCDNRYFNAKDVRHFAEHPSASFLSVRVGEDGQQLFENLKDLPNLRALNVDVEANAADEYWAALPKLKTLELFNWGGGSIDAELLQAMGKMPKLRILRLQGQAELAKDFPEGLKHLTKLEELSLNTNRKLCDKNEIYAALIAIPRLENWPQLKQPSKATLRAFAARPNRTRVSIDGLGKDATVDDVVAVLNTDALTYLNLDLESAPLTPQIAQAIERNTNLEHLSLTVDEFDGAVFTRLENLQRLDYASVGVGIRVKNLDVLSKLPALEGLQLFANPALPGDLEFVSKCNKQPA